MEVRESAAAASNSSVDELSRQLELSTMLSRQADWSNISQARVDLVRSIALRYLQGSCTDMALMELQQNQLAVMLCKQHLEKLTNESNALDQELAALHMRESEDISSSLSGFSREDNLTPKELLGKKRSTRSSKESNRRKPSDATGSMISLNTQTNHLRLKKASKSSIKSKSQSTTKMTHRKLKEIEEEMHTKNQEIIANEEVKLPLYKVPLYAEAWEKFTASELVNVKEMQMAADRALVEVQRSTEMYNEAGSNMIKTRKAMQSRYQASVLQRRKSLASSINSVKRLEQMSSEDGVKARSSRRVSSMNISGGSERNSVRMMLRTSDNEGGSTHSSDTRPSIRTSVSSRSRSASRVTYKQLDENTVEMNEKRETLKACKSHLDDCTNRLESLKQRLEDCFEEFCLAEYGTPAPQIEEEPAKDQPILKNQDILSDKPSELYNRLREQILPSTSSRAKVIGPAEVLHLHCRYTEL